MEDFFRIGVITTTHGLKGEVKVFPTTDDLNRFIYLKNCFVKINDMEIKLVKKGCKFFKNMVILAFEGIDTVEDAEKFKQCDLMVKRSDAIPLDDNEYFISDILGAKVVLENNEYLGEIKDVIQTKANDVYDVLAKDGKQILLPVIEECVLNIDVENKTVTVRLMKGLI